MIAMKYISQAIGVSLAMAALGGILLLSIAYTMGGIVCTTSVLLQTSPYSGVSYYECWHPEL